MDFYTMLMREGKDGNNDPVLVQNFIQQENAIGFGDPDGGQGFNNFKSMKPGDVVIIRAGGQTLAMVEIMNSKVEEYAPNQKNTDFEWLRYTRRVKILSWYNEDNDKYGLPDFNWVGFMKTCVSVVDKNLREARTWYEAIMANNLKNKLISILEKNYNLILTGAPGTGKTFLAKKLAYALTGDTKENHPHVGFCQFHPSFDYTDFVEGLRPTPPDENGNIGFKLRDGIFKSLCEKAIQKRQSNFEQAYASFAKELENYDNDNLFKLKTPSNKKEFGVCLNRAGNLSLFTGKNLKHNGVLTRENLQFFRDMDWVGWGGYFNGVLNYLKEKHGFQENPEAENQKYVFIIDEINRGDISKIFGELFFAIDPGYRGEDGKIKTQYSNLHKDGDIFKEWFYVPKNVYIIGTMNDIDRSVESMDFAIRRRFSWVEIKAEKATDMWDDVIPEYKEQADKYMTRLNAAISKIDSLGDAFHIGPAYFLKLKDYGCDKQGFQKLWDLHLAPLLREYLRGTPHIDTALKQLNNTYFQEQESLEE